MPSPFLETDRNSQARTRRYRRFIDQHGRRWGGECEIMTGHPIQLRALFEAPVVPPTAYLKFDVNEDNPAEMHINYDAWVADRTTAEEDWDRRRLALGVQLHGDRSEERRVGKECRSRWSPYH